MSFTIITISSLFFLLLSTQIFSIYAETLLDPPQSSGGGGGGGGGGSRRLSDVFQTFSLTCDGPIKTFNFDNQPAGVYKHFHLYPNIDVGNDDFIFARTSGNVAYAFTDFNPYVTSSNYSKASDSYQLASQMTIPNNQLQPFFSVLCYPSTCGFSLHYHGKGFLNFNRPIFPGIDELLFPISCSSSFEPFNPYYRVPFGSFLYHDGPFFIPSEEYTSFEFIVTPQSMYGIVDTYISYTDYPSPTHFDFKFISTTIGQINRIIINNTASTNYFIGIFGRSPESPSVKIQAIIS